MLRLRARRLVLLLAALTALLLTGCAGVTTTSGPTGVGGQNRVWAFTPAAQLLAPQTTSQSSCLRPGFTASAIGTASGFCVAAEEAAGVAGDAGSVLRHYTTDEGAAGIEATGTIRPSADGNTYLTPDRYGDGPSARAGLNLSHTPTGYFELPTPRGAPAPTPVAGGTGSEVPVPGPVSLPPGTPFNWF